MRFWILAALCTGLAVAHSAGAVLPTRSEEPHRVLPTPAPQAPGIEWSVLLANLHLEFVDPVTDRRYTASGPFELVSEEVDQIELRAATGAGETAPFVTIVRRGDALWALARFSDREFATRLE